MHVWPVDLDTLGHMNNGRYVTLQDFGRTDWLIRTGIYRKFSKRNMYAVVGAQTTTYRKSLTLGMKYDIETVLIGFDEFSVYLEQRFVVKGEIYARSWVRGRILQKGRGPVAMSDVKALLPEAFDREVPAEVREWAESTRLPSTRREAPSEWNF